MHPNKFDYTVDNFSYALARAQNSTIFQVYQRIVGETTLNDMHVFFKIAPEKDVDAELKAYSVMRTLGLHVPKISYKINITENNTIDRHQLVELTGDDDTEHDITETLRNKPSILVTQAISGQTFWDFSDNTNILEREKNAIESIIIADTDPNKGNFIKTNNSIIRIDPAFALDNGVGLTTSNWQDLEHHKRNVAGYYNILTHGNTSTTEDASLTYLQQRDLTHIALSTDNKAYQKLYCQELLQRIKDKTAYFESNGLDLTQKILYTRCQALINITNS